MGGEACSVCYGGTKVGGSTSPYDGGSLHIAHEATNATCNGPHRVGVSCPHPTASPAIPEKWERERESGEGCVCRVQRKADELVANTRAGSARPPPALATVPVPPRGSVLVTLAWSALEKAASQTVSLG